MLCLYVILIASTILRIRTTGCTQTRQSPYGSVGDYSDQGGPRYQPLDRLFCKRYWLSDIWCLRYAWWRTSFLMNCLGIELVLCDLYITRFVLTKGLLFDTFFIVMFTNYVIVMFLSLWVFDSNHFQYQCIGKPIKSLKSNATQTRFCFEKSSAAGNIFLRKKCAAGKTFVRKWDAGKFFWLNVDGYSVLLM